MIVRTYRISFTSTAIKVFVIILLTGQPNYFAGVFNVTGSHFSGNQTSAICKHLEGDRGKLAIVPEYVTSAASLGFHQFKPVWLSLAHMANRQYQK